jgi:hypothetical protein
VITASDGGPAYPRSSQGPSGDWDSAEGMSLRDVFAAAPMSDVELETLRQAFEKRYPTEPPSLARIRLFRADTMLEAREQWYRENQKPDPVVAPAVGMAIDGETIREQAGFPEVK